MSPDDKVNQLNAIKPQTTPKTYNPREPLATEDLITIIASHDKLQAWNNATEIALQFDNKSDHSDPALIQNIRETAALIISSGRNIHSQNFELRRAIELSDKTLSMSKTAHGFALGILHEATSPARAIVELQQPSSMKISVSNKRVEDLENAIMYFGSQALDIMKQAPATIVKAASFTCEHPDIVTKNITESASNLLTAPLQNINNLPTVIANGLRNENPEQTIGFGSGIIAFGIIKDALSSSGRKMRDFSMHMSFTSKGNVHTVTYAPTNDHYLKASVVNGTLRFDVKKSDGITHGFGDEMFTSMVRIYENNGIDIHRLQAAWDTEGPKSTNGRQFLDNISSGMSRENAAFNTYTGQQAKTLNMNKVTVPPMAPIDNSIHPLYFKSQDQHSSLAPQSTIAEIASHIKTLGVAPEKEQMLIAHIEQKIQASISRDNSAVV